jgi:hypothetical protein
MMQTNAKAIAAAVVGALVTAIAQYTGYAVSDEVRTAGELVVATGLSALVAAVFGYVSVWWTNNAPSGGVVTVVPERIVGTGTPVEVVRDATGAVMSRTLSR